MAGNLISSVLSLATKLLPSITASVRAPSSSSSNSDNSERWLACAIQEDLERLMRTLKWIRATLYDAEEREIIDRSVKFWLKELKKVAYDAEDVLSEYRYEVTRVQVEAKKASEASGSHKRKHMEYIEYIVSIPDGMVDRLKKIRCRFDEITKDREALQLRESDGARRPNNKISRPPTGHMVDEASIFGRDAETEEVVNFLQSEKEKPFSVISIIGKGGLGKTTIAQLVYKDERVTRCFDLFGWVCVSEEFHVGRLTKAIIESVSKINYGLSELSSLQEKLAEIVKGKAILLVLDDVWNENQSLWELFRVPFKEAKLVRILVTTRNKKVAEIMQTTTYFRPTNLPDDLCWQLFQHYAFSDTSDTKPKNLVDVGRDIMRKCGGLPLAVKSIASLLRHETNKEGWREILESDLWESNSSNDIFPALQISYAHLPPRLKPCFLLCSMYPKDYKLEKLNLIELWISHGYIESTGKRRIEEIAGEYYEELKERSFLDEFADFDFHGPLECCKLHDIIHDLARLNSENENYSVQINQPLDIHNENVPQEAYHLYVDGSAGYVNQILQENMNGLRTISIDLRKLDLNLMLSLCYKDRSRYVHICNLTKFEALRVLELKGEFLIDIPDSISELKHLAYLGITSSRLKMLTLSIGLLYNLQTLNLRCRSLEYLPEHIGNLLNLQFLKIGLNDLSNLPKSLCELSNLLRLFIGGDNFLDYVPHGLVNFPAIKTMRARLRVKTIAWLKDITDLEGISNLKDAQRANMRNKCKLETLNLNWETNFRESLYNPEESEVILNLKPEACEDKWVGVHDAAFSWLESLQPHPNLKKLQLKFYSSATVLGWVSDPSSLQSIQEIWLYCCFNIESLPFRNLHTLKQLIIHTCSSIRVLQLEQLPSQLEELHIYNCHHLELITGLGNLKMLAKLRIDSCEVLKSITMDGLQLVESTEPIGDSSHGKPHIDRQSISSLPNLKKLLLRNYSSATVLGWMSDPSSLQSIQEIWLDCCFNIESLPFSNFHTLKHLKIHACDRIRVLQLEQLPSLVEGLHIYNCQHLELITGLGNLDMLATLKISSCKVLNSITMDGLQLVESTEPIGDSSHGKPHIGKQSISSLTNLEIKYCDLLCVLPDGLIPFGPCYVRVYQCGCPDLKRN